jgi:hypothetical protein
MSTPGLEGADTLVLQRELQGRYELRDLLVGQGSSRTLRLNLYADGAAVLEICFSGIGSIVERGTWKRVPGSVQIHWTELEGESINLRMVFELRGRDLMLVGPDPKIFGAADIRLQNMDAPPSDDAVSAEIPLG